MEYSTEAVSCRWPTLARGSRWRLYGHGGKVCSPSLSSERSGIGFTYASYGQRVFLLPILVLIRSLQSLDHPQTLKLADTTREDLLVWSRRGKTTQSTTNRVLPPGFWIRRLRSGNLTLARKSARWTVDDDMCLPGCWIRDFCKSGCHCRRHDKARRQTQQTINVVVVDAAAKQTFEGLLQKVKEVLGEDAVIDDSMYLQLPGQEADDLLLARVFHEKAFVDEQIADLLREYYKDVIAKAVCSSHDPSISAGSTTKGTVKAVTKAITTGSSYLMGGGQCLRSSFKMSKIRLTR